MAKRAGRPKKNAERNGSLSPSALATMAANASPGDVAEMCLELIKACPEPRVAASKLLPKVEAIARRGPLEG